MGIRTPISFTSRHTTWEVLHCPLRETDLNYLNSTHVPLETPITGLSLPSAHISRHVAPGRGRPDSRQASVTDPDGWATWERCLDNACAVPVRATLPIRHTCALRWRLFAVIQVSQAILTTRDFSQPSLGFHTGRAASDFCDAGV